MVQKREQEGWPLAVVVAGAQVLEHLTCVLAQEQWLPVSAFQLGEQAQASLLMSYTERQETAKQAYGNTHVSSSSPPNVRLPNCTGNFSYAAFLPPKLMPESDEGEFPGRMTAWSLNRALLRAAEKAGRLYDLVEAVTLDGVPGVARPGGGLMVPATEGIGTVTGATGGSTGSDLGSGAGGTGIGAGAGADSAGSAGTGGASATGSGTQPLAVSRSSSSFVSAVAVAVGSSSQLGSCTVAGFSHSVEYGSGTRSVPGRDGGGREEVGGGPATSVWTCCTGAGGGAGFGTGLR